MGLIGIDVGDRLPFVNQTKIKQKSHRFISDGFFVLRLTPDAQALDAIKRRVLAAVE